MSAVYELNELEIDEISLVDQGANEGATVMLMKRHVEEEADITKRLEAAQDEIILQKMAGIAKRLWPNLSGSDETKAVVLKHVEALGGEARSAVLQFLAAADGALADRLIEKGAAQTGDGALGDEEQALHEWAHEFAHANNISIPVAKARLVSENKEAAALFRRALARVKKRDNQ